MGYITLTSLGLSPTPSTSTVVTVEYRLGGSSGAYTLVTSTATILANGDFSPPINIVSLLDNTDYEVRITANCDGGLFSENFITGTTTTSTTTTTTLTHNMTVSNNSTISGNAVNSVDPAFYVLVSGTFPVNNSETYLATHSGDLGAIGVNIDAPTGGSKLSLKVNGTLQECIDVTGTAATYTFAAITFSSSDNIDIILEDGAC